MPWVTIVDNGHDRRSAVESTSSSPGKRQQESQPEENPAHSYSNETLIHTPSKGETKSCHSHDYVEEQEEKSVRTCFSPDSVMAWPGGENDTSPVKRQLDLRSPPSSPYEKIYDIAVGGDSIPLKVDVIVEDTSSAELEDNPKDHPMSRITDDSFPILTRRVSFADESGSLLQEVHVLEPPLYRRVVLLLLSPNDRKFEFLHLEYPLDDNTTVQVLVDQIPKLAANPVFRKFTFSCLARTSKNQKLDNTMLIADFDLAENELLLGILMGYAANEIGTCAVPLLLNGDIIKAVNRAKKSGKGLKTVKSGHEWRRRGKLRKIPKSWTRKGTSPLIASIDETTIPTSDVEDSSTIMEESSSGDEEIVTKYLVSYQESAQVKDPTSAQDVAEMISNDESDGTENQVFGQKATQGSSLENNARSVVEQLVSDEDNVHDFDLELVTATIDHCPDQEQLSEDASLNESVDEGMEEMPDMENPECVYPDLVRDYLGSGADKAVFFIHAMSIAAVGYLATMAMK